MKLRTHRASVLMEFTMVMPLLLLFILGIVQFSMIWIAREMTYYAAYSAARTAMVYNPSDYTDDDGKFYSKEGVVYTSALKVISMLNINNNGDILELWNVSTSTTSMGSMSGLYATYGNGGMLEVWNSSSVLSASSSTSSSTPWDNIEDLVEIYNGTDEPYRTSEDLTDINAVRVTVKFKFPLSIPFVSALISDADNDVDGYWDMVAGYISSIDNDANSYKYITLTETCILPKPIDTSAYPTLPVESN